MKEIKYIVIHHSAVSRETQPAQFYAINRYHKEKFNMLSTLGYYIGYNYYIGTNGAVTQTRSHEEETAAVKGHNNDSIHICLAGDFDLELPTNKQEESLMRLIDDLHEEYPKATVKLHRELDKNRGCPGLRIDKKYIKSVINFPFEYLRAPADDQDTDKAKQIEALQKQLDSLMEMLHNLLIKLGLK